MLLLPLLAAHAAQITTTGTFIRSQPEPPPKIERRPDEPTNPPAAAEVTRGAANQPAAAPTPVQAVSEEGFRTGVDTLAVVTARLGRPNMTESNSDGTTTIRYSSVRTHVKGATFIPIVGLFAGGAKGHSSVRAFTFGPDGRLKSFSSGDFQTQCGMFGNCH